MWRKGDLRAYLEQVVVFRGVRHVESLLMVAKKTSRAKSEKRMKMISFLVYDCAILSSKSRPTITAIISSWQQADNPGYETDLAILPRPPTFCLFECGGQRLTG